jgi:hypothetical protein
LHLPLFRPLPSSILPSPPPMLVYSLPLYPPCLPLPSSPSSFPPPSLLPSPFNNPLSLPPFLFPLSLTPNSYVQYYCGFAQCPG